MRYWLCSCVITETCVTTFDCSDIEDNICYQGFDGAPNLCKETRYKCPHNIICGDNAECYLEGTRSRCRCVGGYTLVGFVCIKTCETSFDCVIDEQICEQGSNGPPNLCKAAPANCSDAVILCGDNASCLDGSGPAKCQCNAKYTLVEDECQAVVAESCVTSYDCTADGDVCLTGPPNTCGAAPTCTDPAVVLCGDYATCKVKTNKAVCECKAVNPLVEGRCREQCETSFDCLNSRESCRKGNPMICIENASCDGSVECGDNAHCLEDSSRAKCECDGKYTRVGDECQETCETSFDCRIDEQICEQGSNGSANLCKEAPPTCSGDVICGTNAKCIVNSGVAGCQCDANYAPFEGVCRETCVTSYDCTADGEVCLTGSPNLCTAAPLTCTDPAVVLCGDYATCKVKDDKAVCECKEANPLVEGRCQVICPNPCCDRCESNQDCMVDNDGVAKCECKEGQTLLSKHGHCQSMLTCVNGTVRVSNGELICTCNEGYQKSKDGQCTKDAIEICFDNLPNCIANENNNTTCICPDGSVIQSGMCGSAECGCGVNEECSLDGSGGMKCTCVDTFTRINSNDRCFDVLTCESNETLRITDDMDLVCNCKEGRLRSEKGDVIVCLDNSNNNIISFFCVLWLIVLMAIH